jgi:hypothetical protein
VLSSHGMGSADGGAISLTLAFLASPQRIARARNSFLSARLESPDMLFSLRSVPAHEFLSIRSLS